MFGRAAAPWERDDREAQKLDARLHRALLDNKSLQDAVAEKDQQLREHSNDLREAISNLRKQTQLTTEADQKAEKTLDDLRRQKEINQTLQSTLDQSREKVEKEAKMCKDLQRELDNYSSSSASSMHKERSTLQARIQQLERELNDAKGSTSAAASRAALQIIELEKKVMTLQTENSRLLEHSPSSSYAGGTFPLTTPARPTRAARNGAFAGATDEGFLGTPARRRPRSSSLNPDLRLVRLEQELERCKPFEAELETTRVKLEKAKKDLVDAENAKLSVERRAQREMAEMREALEDKDDELEGLRRIADEIPNSEELQAKLEEKDGRLRDLAGRIGGMERQVGNRINVLNSNISRRRERRPPSPPPPPSPRFSRSRSSSSPSTIPPSAPHSDSTPLLRKIEELEAELSEKSRLLWERTLQPDPSSSQLVIPVDSVPRTEHEALQAECEELEKEIDQQQEALERERAEASRNKRDLQLLRDEFEQVSAAHQALKIQVAALKVDAQTAETRAADLEAELEGAREDATVRDTAARQVEFVQRDLEAARSAFHRSARSLEHLELQRRSLLDDLAAVDSELTREPHVTAVKEAPVIDESQLSEVLTTVERLREERNELRRNLMVTRDEGRAEVAALQEQISQCESRITSLQMQLANSLQETAGVRSGLEATIEKHQLELDACHQRLKLSRSESTRLRSLATASLITVSYFNDESDIRQTSYDLQNKVCSLEEQLEQSHLALAAQRGQLRKARSSSAQASSVLSVLSIVVQNLDARHERSTEEASARLQEVLSEVATLDANIMSLETEKERTVKELEDALVSWREANEHVASAWQVEEERDELQMRCDQLEKDVAILREQLGEAQEQYRNSHYDQPASSDGDDDPSTEVTRKEIEHLELRIARRTEQIGVHQAEIARLETNMSLLEDANAELSADLETVTVERDNALADSTQIREDRDRALMCVEDLEEQLDALDKELQDSKATETELRVGLLSASELHDEQVVALVGEIFSAMSRATLAEQVLASSHEALVEAAELETRLQVAEHAHMVTTSELSVLSEQHQKVQDDLDEKEKALDELREELASLEEVLIRSTSDADDARMALEARNASASRAEEDLKATIASLQTRLSILSSQESSIQDSAAELESLRIQLESAVMTSNNLQTSKEKLEAELAELKEEHLRKLDALALSHDSEQAVLKARQSELEDAVQRWNNQCDELEQRLASLQVEKNEEMATALRDLELSHSMKLSEIRGERDEALASIEGLKTEIHELVSVHSAEMSSLQIMLSDASRAAQVCEDNQRAAELDLGDARLKLATQDTTIQALQQELASLREDQQARSEEMKSMNGMILFSKNEAKRMESEVSKMKRDLKVGQDQIEQHRRLAHETGISVAKEKLKLEQEMTDLRNEVQNSLIQRDDAIAKLSSEENQISELHKAQRKRDVQIALLKERISRLQRAQPVNGPPSVPKEEPITESSATRPLASTRRVSSEIHSSRNPVPLRASISQSARPRSASSTLAPVRLLSSSTSRQPPNPVPSRPVSPVVLLKPQAVPVPPTTPHSSSTHPFLSPNLVPEEPSSTGKRKRQSDDDDVENRSPRPIIAAPRSPSRIRQVAERGLRQFTPKRTLSVKRERSPKFRPPPVPPLPTLPGSDITNGSATGSDGPSKTGASLPLEPPRKKGGMRDRLTMMMLTR